jgi:predicted NUDIX family NTP pyrophosphohydrolase
MINTYGIFIICEGKLLVCHVTNSNHYSIPKGLPDEREYAIDTIKRELKEETDIDFSSLKIVSQKLNKGVIYKTKKKVLSSITAICDNKINEFDLKCNSLVNDSFPENDSFHWVTKAEALSMNIHESQKEIIRELNF